MTKKILIIDDNASILFIMQKALQIKDYVVEITETFDGVDAIVKIAPDLIYLDISLLDKDGREVSRELKAHQATKDIPIVVLTAYNNADQLAREAQAEGYLAKPFELKNLWNTTEHYAKEHTLAS